MVGIVLVNRSPTKRFRSFNGRNHIVIEGAETDYQISMGIEPAVWIAYGLDVRGPFRPREFN
jgi:hypothetical protein